MNKKILLIGGGGHCKSVLDSLLETEVFDEIGIIDSKENIGGSILGVPIIGCDEDLPFFLESGYEYAFVSLGSVGNPINRIRLYNQVQSMGFKIPNIIDRSARVSKNTLLEQGIFIGKQCIVNAGVSIQKCAIINSGSIVEHDCQVGSFSHISPGAVLSGGVQIGENSHVGSNTTIKQQVCVGSDSIIGMGSVVLKNIESRVMAYGNPCKEAKKI